MTLFLTVLALTVGAFLGKLVGKQEQMQHIADTAYRASTLNRTFTIFRKGESIECKVLKVSLL